MRDVNFLKSEIERLEKELDEDIANYKKSKIEGSKLLIEKLEKAYLGKNILYKEENGNRINIIKNVKQITFTGINPFTTGNDDLLNFVGEYSIMVLLINHDKNRGANQIQLSKDNNKDFVISVNRYSDIEIIDDIYSTLKKEILNTVS